jgi:hypothetical protein
MGEWVDCYGLIICSSKALAAVRRVGEGDQKGRKKSMRRWQPNPRQEQQGHINQGRVRSCAPECPVLLVLDLEIVETKTAMCIKTFIMILFVKVINQKY